MKKKTVLTLLLLFFAGVAQGQDSLKYSGPVNTGISFECSYSLCIRDVMTIDGHTGKIEFFTTPDSAAKVFANWLETYYSSYCDSLRREIIELKKARKK